jgi:aryl-alcohol dehydrogenase-like predicted oxidoreductase
MTTPLEQETRELGRTGLRVTRLGFGAWAIGSKGYGPVEHADAEDALQAYLDGGGNFLDTARGYAESERIIGQFLQARPGLREKLVIASKLGMHDPGQLRENLQVSLENLQLASIDLLYLHSPPEDEQTMDRVLEVFEEFKAQGKIRAIGASIKGPAVTDQTVELCRRYIRSGRVDALQVIFSVFRQKNLRMFEQAREAGVALVGRTALESGFLTGKYRPGATFPEGDHRNRWSLEKRDEILQEVDRLSREHLKPPYPGLTQFVLRYVLDEPRLTSMLVGGKNAQQVRQQMKAVELPPLPEAQRAALRTYYSGFEELLNPGDG